MLDGSDREWGLEGLKSALLETRDRSPSAWSSRPLEVPGPFRGVRETTAATVEKRSEGELKSARDNHSERSVREASTPAANRAGRRQARSAAPVTSAATPKKV